MTLLVALLAPAFAQAQICPDPVEVKVSDRLIAELIDWIDANSKYKISALPPARIQFCKSDVTFALDDAGIIVDPGLQSAYDPATQTIYMTAPWSPINPEMSSIILHNLVHHAQTQLAEWPCLRATQFEAFWLQDRWINHQGYRTGFDWTQILVDSHCPQQPDN
jgi:hypothetical protein